MTVNRNSAPTTSAATLEWYEDEDLEIKRPLQWIGVYNIAIVEIKILDEELDAYLQVHGFRMALYSPDFELEEIEFTQIGAKEEDLVIT